MIRRILRALFPAGSGQVVISQISSQMHRGSDSLCAICAKKNIIPDDLAGFVRPAFSNDARLQSILPRVVAQLQRELLTRDS